MNQRNKGFTIIEIMLVVMIIGILAVIAIPAYQKYAMRAKVSESLLMLSGQKNAVTEYYAAQGVMPGSNAQAGLAEPDQISSKYVSSVEIIEDGIIRATFRGDEFDGHSISLIPTAEHAGLRVFAWHCTSSLSANFLPSSCSSEGD